MSKPELPTQPGIYLVKGSPDVFWFLWPDTNDYSLQFKLRPSRAEIVECLTSQSWEPTAYVIAGAAASDLSELRKITTVPHPVFILLSEGTTLSKDQEKVWKKLAGGPFQQIDISRLDWWQLPTIKQALAQFPPGIGEQLRRDIHSPQLLLELLQSGDPLDYETSEAEEDTIERMLQGIIDRDLSPWEETVEDRAKLYRLFGAAEVERCGFYLVTKGMCPSLWLHWEPFSRATTLPLNLAVKLFVRWVYICTHFYQAGLKVRLYRGKRYYSFTSSPSAFNALIYAQETI